jgi:hypothetical protein
MWLVILLVGLLLFIVLPYIVNHQPSEGTWFWHVAASHE